MVRGAQEGAAVGNRAAGPVGGAVGAVGGGVVGGVAGGVKGVLGIPQQSGVRRTSIRKERPAPAAERPILHRHPRAERSGPASAGPTINSAETRGPRAP